MPSLLSGSSKHPAFSSFSIAFVVALVATLTRHHGVVVAPEHNATTALPQACPDASNISSRAIYAETSTRSTVEIVAGAGESATAALRRGAVKAECAGSWQA